MVLNIKELNLTKRYLDNKYGEENIFQFLFPDKIVSKRLYKNPLRQDKSEGCSFMYMGNTFTFKDYSKGINYNWTTFGIESMNMNLNELFKYVNKNMTIITNKEIHKQEYQSQILSIDIKSKPYLLSELFKFKDYVCSEQLLQKANIFSVKTIYYNGECAFENCSNIYAFLNIDETGKKNYQLYFPNKDKNKRYRSITTKLIPQLESIDLKAKYVIITKSNMDAFILKHILEFNTIAILNEGVVLSDDFMNKLNSRYKIVLLFDNDKAGRSAVIKYKKLFPHIDFKVLFVPFKYGKDIKDVVSNYNVEDVKQVLWKRLKLNP